MRAVETLELLAPLLAAERIQILHESERGLCCR